MTRALRVLRSGACHPAFNMALDEALLHSIDSPPTLRLYRWQPHGVSLGYFQKAAVLPVIRGDHVLVRRITGGGAIFHGDEITFSVAVDAGVLPSEIPASYDLLHEAVRRALADVGVTARRRGAHARTAARPDAAWCFADPVCEDLLTAAGAKILGSAQRRIRTPQARVLHHGSLVLDAPADTPFCGSVAAAVSPRAVEAELEDALIRRMAAALELEPECGEPTSTELEHAHQLVEEKFGTNAFTHRR